MARRPPKPSEDDRRLWKRVTHTVTPKAPTKPDYVASDAVEAALAEMAALLGEPAPEVKPAKTRASRKKSGKSATPATAVTSASSGENVAAMAEILAGRTKPRPITDKPVPEDLEPNRKRRLSRERDPIEARFDLHGYSRFEAEDQLRAFLMGCQARGMKSVLVITGQGRQGGGIIRASFQDWMASPHLRLIVSGYSPAHRRHGGEGAFYVTLRQRF